MSRKAEYRKFLQSAFWKELSARKKANVRRCQKCKKKGQLQSHHVRYPDNWYDTTEADLVVLCRKCHRKEHGIGNEGLFVPYREDETFNAMMHRISRLGIRVRNGQTLRERDNSFLEHCLKAYPETNNDGAVEFHVKMVLKYAEIEGFKRFNSAQPKKTSFNTGYEGE